MKTKTRNSKSGSAKTPRGRRRPAVWIWLDAKVVVVITLVVGIIGFLTHSPGTVVAANMAYARLVGVALLCYKHRLSIAEVVLEVGAIILRIFKS